MRSFSELFFDLLVNLDVTLKGLNLRLHFVVFEQQLLSLFGLIFKLSCKLVVLKDSQASGRLQLFVVESEQVGLGLLDFVEHVLPEFLGSLDLFTLFLIDIVDSLFLFSIESILVLI